MKYYVYRIFNEYGDTLYIGKGSGARLENQIKRFGFFGEKIAEGLSEDESLRREIRLIAKHNPPLNKTKGGERGGRAEELNVFFELCRLVRIARRQPDVAGGLMKIVSSNINRLGFDVCRKEFAKFNVHLERPQEALNG